MEDVKLNIHGVNLEIKATVLQEDKMRSIGFTDYAKEKWHFSKMIKFPNIKRYKGFEISFNVSINKVNSDDLRIDILDDDYCQPYDYQSMLERSPEFEPCIIVKEQVENWMKYLQDAGVLNGHEYGDYI